MASSISCVASWAAAPRAKSAPCIKQTELWKREYEMDDPPLLAFRIIGCSVVAIFVGVTIIIYITSGMFYPDCLVQICSEICLLCAYTCILLITTEAARLDRGFCLGVAIFLQYIFMSFFLFMLLEVFCMARCLLEFMPKNVLTTWRSLLFVGFGLPFLITGLSAIILYNQYTSKRNCWLNMSGDALWASVGPVCVFVAVHALLLVMVVCVSEVPYYLSVDEYDRAFSFLKTRWSSLIITPCAILSWIFGILASDTNKESFYAAFTVASIFLGVIIFTLRISTDDEIRKVMTSHVLSHLAGSRNKVTIWTEKVAAGKPPTIAKKFAMDVPRINSTGQLTAHR